jgi:hypothetical protein
MADLSNIRNSGVFIGGNSNSSITVGATGPTGNVDGAEVLRQLDTLFAKLLAGVGQLPAERAGEVASETVRLRGELARTGQDRDPGRVRALLGSLTKGVAAVAPLAGLVTDITELISRLPH